MSDTHYTEVHFSFKCVGRTKTAPLPAVEMQRAPGQRSKTLLVRAAHNNQLILLHNQKKMWLALSVVLWRVGSDRCKPHMKNPPVFGSSMNFDERVNWCTRPVVTKRAFIWSRIHHRQSLWAPFHSLHPCSCCNTPIVVFPIRISILLHPESYHIHSHAWKPYHLPDKLAWFP